MEKPKFVLEERPEEQPQQLEPKKTEKKLTYKELQERVESRECTSDEIELYATMVDADRRAHGYDKSWLEAEAKRLKEKEEALDMQIDQCNSIQAGLETDREQLDAAYRNWEGIHKSLLNDLDAVKDFYQQICKEYPDFKKLMEPEFELDPNWYNDEKQFEEVIKDA